MALENERICPKIVIGVRDPSGEIRETIRRAIEWAKLQGWYWVPFHIYKNLDDSLPMPEEFDPDASTTRHFYFADVWCQPVLDLNKVEE